MSASRGTGCGYTRCRRYWPSWAGWPCSGRPGCSLACHSQTFPVMALHAARSRGLPVADAAFAAQVEHVATFLTENADKYRSGAGTGGQVDSAGYLLLALELAGGKRTDETAAVVE